MRKEYITHTITCDKCNVTICEGVQQGFAFRGNAHAIDPNDIGGAGGGLIGNNFDDYGNLKNTSHFCIPCIKEILEL